MNNIKIKYLDYEYSITDEFESGLTYIGSGTTSIWTNQTITIDTEGTHFYVDDAFITSSQTNDNILITIYDDSSIVPIEEGLLHPAYLNYYTEISSISSNILTITGDIPLDIFNDLAVDGYSYRIRNLHYAELTMLDEYINVSPFSEVLTAEFVFDQITNSANIVLSVNNENKYFDYQFMTLDHEQDGSLTSHKFETQNQYTYYELDTFIDNIFAPFPSPINIYNENKLIANEYYIQEIYDNSHNTSYLAGTWYPIQSSRYKIIPFAGFEDKLRYFKPYTYIDFGILTEAVNTITYYYYSGGTLMQSSVTYTDSVFPYEMESSVSDTGKTMITEVHDNYMIIEKPFVDNTVSGFTGGTNIYSGYRGIYDIINIAKTTDISDILMKTYINDDNDYYHTKSDSERYRIYGAYGQIIKNNTIIHNNASGLIYQDENDLFNLDIFNIDINNDYIFEDENLLYKPIELIDLGIDKKIKPPKLLNIKNFNIPDKKPTMFLSGVSWRDLYVDFYADMVFAHTGETIQFYNITSGLTTWPSTEWLWDFGDGNTDTTINPTHTYNNLGIYSVKLTAVNIGVIDWEYKMDYIGIYGDVVASFHANDTTVLTDEEVFFYDDSLGYPTDWLWDFGDPGSGDLNSATTENVSHIYENLNIYTISLIASNPISSDSYTAVSYVRVVDRIVADFDIVETCPQCPTYDHCVPEGSSVTFSSSNTTGGATYYSWYVNSQFIETTNNTDHPIPFLNSGDYTIMLEAWNIYTGDAIIKENYLIVYKEIISDFYSTKNTLTPEHTYFQPYNKNNNIIDFHDNSVGLPTEWLWDFGDGNTSTEQHPQHHYSSIGEYSVTLSTSTIFDTGVIVKTDYIDVREVYVDFETDPNTIESRKILCDDPLNNYINFENNSAIVPLITTVINWSWSFGDGGSSTDEVPTHQYTSTGDYDVSLTVSTPYGEEQLMITNYIRVGKINPDFTFTAPSTPIIPGIDIQFTSFIGVENMNLSNDPLDYLWFFGDTPSPSTDENPIHQYSSTGVYDVILTVSNDYGTTAVTHQVSIENGLYVNFEIPSNICTVTDLEPVDISIGNPTSWSWTFGDGGSSTDEDPTHQYTSTGNYDVSLTASTAFETGYKTNQITVHEKVEVTNIERFPLVSSLLLINQDIYFTGTTTGDVISYEWNWGDSNSTISTSTSNTDYQSYSYSASGNYNITLTANNQGCDDNETLLITVTEVNELFELEIITNSTNGYEFQIYNIVNEITIFWDYENNIANQSIIPAGTSYFLHTYTVSGTYSLRIFGSMPDLIFSGNTTITKVVNWGVINSTEMETITFEDCTNLCDLPDDSSNFHVNDANYIFKNTALTEIPDHLFHESTTITEFKYTFSGCTGLNTNISDHLFEENVLVTTFEGVFSYCSTLVSLNIPSGIFSGNTHVTDFSHVFEGCSGFATATDALNYFWANNIVEDFSYSFSRTGIRKIPDFGPSNNNVKIFRHACSYTQIGDGIYSPNPTDKLWESKFNDYSEVTDFSYVFAHTHTYNPSGPPLYITEVFKNHHKVETFEGVFSNCTKLEIIKTTDTANLLFNTNIETLYRGAFSGCSSLILDNDTHSNSNLFFGSTGATNLSHCFEGCNNINEGFLNVFSVLENLEDISYCFANITNSNKFIIEDYGWSVFIVNYWILQNNHNLKTVRGLFKNTKLADWVGEPFWMFSKYTHSPSSLSANSIEDFSYCFENTTWSDGSTDGHPLWEKIFGNSPNALTFEGTFSNNLNFAIDNDELFKTSVLVTNFSHCFENSTIKEDYDVLQTVFKYNINVVDFSYCFANVSWDTIDSENNFFYNNSVATNFEGVFKGSSVNAIQGTNADIDYVFFPYSTVNLKYAFEDATFIDVNVYALWYDNTYSSLGDTEDCFKGLLLDGGATHTALDNIPTTWGGNCTASPPGCDGET